MSDFDICCTTAYLSHEQLALTLGGSKGFPRRPRLTRFGRVTCRLTPSQIDTAFDDVATGIEAASAELAHYGKVFPAFGETVGAAMRKTWRDNLAAYFDLPPDYELPTDLSGLGRIAALRAKG